MKLSGLFRRAGKLITFTDIPIWQKLLLFAGGGIIWFIIIAAIGLGAVTYVNDASHTLTDKLVPQLQASQKVIIKIRGANVSVHNIVIHDDLDFVNRNFKRARFILDDVSMTLKSLLAGGAIKNYSDLTGELIEEYKVMPIDKDTPVEKYVRQVIGKNEHLRDSLEALAAIKLRGMDRGGLSPQEQSEFMEKLKEYDTLTVQSVMVLGRLTSDISSSQTLYTGRIKTVLKQSMLLFIIVGVFAVLLLTMFSYFLKISITKPLRAITDQIKGLSEGEVDLTKKIDVGSKDEIAELSTNFNVLMHTIHDMNAFKKVIEEDDALEDVYVRLAKVFYEQLGLDELVILEVSDRNVMKLVETPYSKSELCCNKGILVDNNLCRARKTGHIVSSLKYTEICKQYLLSPEKFHVCVPMIVGGSTVGVVQFQFDKTLHNEHERPCPILDPVCIDRQILKAEQYIRESSAVVETKRLTSALRESSVRDQMTGLYNRRFLEEYVETLVASVTRKGGQIGLLMCDLDFFKEVNDKFGHDVGDKVLKETAHVISKSARTADLVIRFGGEEFLVIVNDAKPGDANLIAERIRKQTALAKVKTSSGFIQKTISIGYCEFPTDTQNFWEAIKYADIALYKAKESGRNKVMHFEKEMWNVEAY